MNTNAHEMDCRAEGIGRDARFLFVSICVNSWFLPAGYFSHDRMSSAVLDLRSGPQDQAIMPEPMPVP